MAQAPGEQFLLERLRKVEALPPSERPYDAACFLESYRLQEEVAADLPLLPPKQVVGWHPLTTLKRVLALRMHVSVHLHIDSKLVGSSGHVRTRKCTRCCRSQP